jgi:hypothetical protein
MGQTPGYSRLAPTEARLLAEFASEGLQDAWLGTLEQLDGMVSLYSVARPRPLYFDEEQGPTEVAESLEELRGTPLYDRMARNVEAAAEIRRMWEEQGHTDELHEAADAYLDALGDDYAAVTRHARSAEPPHHD